MSTNKSFDKPLASFDAEKDACNYAYKTKNGFTLPVEGSRVQTWRAQAGFARCARRLRRQVAQ